MGPARGKASPALGAPSPPRSLSSPQTRACLLLTECPRVTWRGSPASRCVCTLGQAA